MKSKSNKSWRKFDYCLRRLCKRPSPTKRLITVLFVCVVLAAINIWFVFSSIYNMGKNSANNDMLKIQSIERLPINYNDSINIIKNQVYDE